MSTPVEDFAAAQAAEYGTYRAIVPILHNGVLAYGPGDPVPVSNVEQYGYLDQGLVADVNDPATPAITPTAPTAPEGDPVVVDSTPQKG